MENDDDDNLVDTLQPIQEMITGDMELDFEAAIPAKEIVTKKRGAAIGKNYLKNMNNLLYLIKYYSICSSVFSRNFCHTT